MGLLKVDFYEIFTADGNRINLPAVFTAIAGRAIPDRNMIRNRGPYRLHLFRQGPGATYEGDMLQTRLDRGVSLAHTNEDPQPIELDDDQGLTESQAFILVPNLRLLALERNVEAGSSAAFAEYANSMGNLIPGIGVQPVLRAEAYDRIMNMQEYKSVEISVAQPRNLRPIGGGDLATEQVARLGNEIGAGHMNLVFSTGHLREPLAVEAVRRMVASLSNQGRDVSVNKIVVTGTDRDNEPDVLDLFKYRLTDEEEVIEGQHRQLPFQNRVNTLRRIVHRNRQELNAILRRP